MHTVSEYPFGSPLLAFNVKGETDMRFKFADAAADEQSYCFNSHSDGIHSLMLKIEVLKKVSN